MSQLAEKQNRELTPYVLEKWEEGTIAFDGDECLTKVLEFRLKLKEEERRERKNLENNLKLHADNERIDTWILLNTLLYDMRIFIIIKNGKLIIELKIFIGFLQNNSKQIPQNLLFTYVMTLLKYFSVKLGKTFNLQKELKNRNES